MQFPNRCIPESSRSRSPSYGQTTIREPASSSDPVLFLSLRPPVRALPGCCGGRGWALAGSAAVWPSSDGSGS
ncbi:unnamed protein product [Tetraodon nigroviridis]|uniref:(spotted green pufferfish) hypothetical protein n=1 Tax=Tetraodon nigroviridis TaxID=99883 RepID=Q4RRV0_TETNG|nr:unnamed protein product [Tetraodon nigroviridis]